MTTPISPTQRVANADVSTLRSDVTRHRQVRARPAASGTQAHSAQRRAAQAQAMVRRADQLLAGAALSQSREERFRQLYQAALRGAGAVLAIGEGGTRRRGSVGAWQRLERVGGFDGWVAHFARLSRLSQQVDLGNASAVATVDLDSEHLRVQEFLCEVEQTLLAGLNAA